jgi:hypothetical protein
LTADIDVTVRLDPEIPERLVAEMERIRDTLGLLQNALAVGDLLPVFEAELRRAGAGRRGSCGAPVIPRRGPGCPQPPAA